MSARLICCLAFFAFASPSSAQEATTSASSAPHSSVPTEFDSFIVVLLVRPSNAPDLPKPELEQLQEKHLANIGRLAKEGKVLKAGPFEDYSGRNVRGMFILKTSSLEEARAWVATDPAVKAGRLAPRVLEVVCRRQSQVKCRAGGLPPLGGTKPAWCSRNECWHG